MSLTSIPSWLLAPRIPCFSPTLYLALGSLNVVLLSIAWLAQRPNTRPIRLALTPVFFGILWQLSGGVEFENRHHMWLNYVWGLAGCYLILLIPRLTFLSEPYTYVGTPIPPSTTIDLLINASLQRWSTPSNYYKATEPNPSLPVRSAWGHVKSHLRAVGVLMATLAIASLFPHLMSSEGASLSDPMVVRDGLGVFGELLQWTIDLTDRRVAEVVVSLCFGVGVYLFIEIIYHANAAACIGLLGWDKSCFPEIFDKPWSSSSMHEFWSKRWHPLFSPTFIFYTLPFLRSPFTAPLALPSIFLLSGLIHDIGALPFDPHLDLSHITLFFFAQFVPLGVERAIRALGGPRVGGWPGFVGTWGWMFVTGRWVVEGWLRKGLLGQVIKTVFPFLQD